jgi:epoxide hydrolase-like predicted phosphatase
MNTPLTTFIFDCFGVLCEPVLYGWYNEHRVARGFVDKNLEHVFEKLDLGVWSEDDLLDYFLTYEGIHVTKEELRAQIDSYLKLDRVLIDIIKKLKTKGFKIALLSNANNSFFEKKVYPIYPEFKNLFDEMIVSSVVGMAKPNPDIYIHTLEKIQSKPEESVFIDDNKINVEAATRLGINGFVYTNPPSFIEHLTKLGIDLHA